MTRVIYCISCARAEVRSKFGPATLFCYECAAQHAGEAMRAISRVRLAVKKGLLPKPSEFACADCGSPATNYDHRDYTKPLEVEPVCVPCNKRRGPGLDSQMRAVVGSAA